MDVEEIIVSIVMAFIGGGGLVALLRYRRGGKHDNIDYAKKIKEFYEERDNNLTERIGKLEEKVGALLKEKERHRIEIERWSGYAEELKGIVNKERNDKTKSDTRNQELEIVNEKLRKELEICKRNK